MIMTSIRLPVKVAMNRLTVRIISNNLPNKDYDQYHYDQYHYDQYHYSTPTSLTLTHYLTLS